MEEIISLHRKEYGMDPDIVVGAPGKITVMGDHTDLGEGSVISIAVDRLVYLAISKRSDNSLRFFNIETGERKRTSISSLRYRREDRWANYPKGVLYSFIQLGCKIKGLNFTIGGNIPKGIGLSFSAALETATALAIKELYQFELTDFQLIESARQVETRFFGRSVGVSNILVSIYAKKDTAFYLDTRSLKYEYIPLNFNDYKLLITDSRVSQGAQDVEQPDYQEEFDFCVDALQSKKPGQSLRDYTIQDIRESVGLVPESIRRRCLHVVEEHLRVEELKTALLANDYTTVGKLFSKAHYSLRDQYEISCPELDWLVKRAKEIPGVLGSKMIGTGFGGCTITLLMNSALDEYDKQLVEYDRIFGFRPETFFCIPSDGARVLFKNETETY